ncbi:MAG: hypothetical protein KAW02_00630 [candidate division Zixibacteria bacterium]|nr:hypothetical protein [candidate division Zixibacteria bacterium]
MKIRTITTDISLKSTKEVDKIKYGLSQMPGTELPLTKQKMKTLVDRLNTEKPTTNEQINF